MVVDEIKKIEEDLKSAEIMKIKAETSLSALRNDYKNIEGDIKELGITDVKKAEEELNNRKEELVKKIEELKGLIPTDIIEKYKNYDFTSDVPDEGLDF